MVKRESDQAFRRVEIESYESPRTELIDYELRCPACDAPMHVKHSVLGRAFFAHNARPGGSCDYAEEESDYAEKGGESFEHRASKNAIVETLRGNPAYKGAEFIQEFAVQTASRKRIADVFVRHVNGRIEIYEAQLASITPGKLEERTADYLTLPDIDFVLWCLGENADTESNRQWCRSRLGHVAFIETHRKSDLKIIGRYSQDLSVPSNRNGDLSNNGVDRERQRSPSAPAQAGVLQAA
jgi:Competence protein